MGIIRFFLAAFLFHITFGDSGPVEQALQLGQSVGLGSGCSSLHHFHGQGGAVRHGGVFRVFHMGAVALVIAHIDFLGALQLIGTVVVEVGVIRWIFRVAAVHTVGFAENDPHRPAVIAQTACITRQAAVPDIRIAVDAVSQHDRVAFFDRIAVAVGVPFPYGIVGLVFRSGQLCLGRPGSADIQGGFLIEIKAVGISQLRHGELSRGLIIIPGGEGHQGIVIVGVGSRIQAHFLGQKIPQFDAFIFVHIPVGGI